MSGIGAGGTIAYLLACMSPQPDFQAFVALGPVQSMAARRMWRTLTVASDMVFSLQGNPQPALTEEILRPSSQFSSQFTKYCGYDCARFTIGHPLDGASSAHPQGPGVAAGDW